MPAERKHTETLLQRPLVSSFSVPAFVLHMYNPHLSCSSGGSCHHGVESAVAHLVRGEYFVETLSLLLDRFFRFMLDRFFRCTMTSYAANRLLVPPPADVPFPRLSLSLPLSLQTGQH